MAKVADIKARNSIGRKWLIGEALTINKYLKNQTTDYGEVVAFDATVVKEDGSEVSEMVFCGAKAIVELFSVLQPEDLPLKARLVEKVSANKRTYQDIEDLS